MEGLSLTQQPPVVRILVGVAGRSLALMAGMAIGATDALTGRRAQISRNPAPAFQPIAVGVSGGAIGAAAIAVGMTGDEARQIAIDYPGEAVLGRKSLRALLRQRQLYPDARIRELAHLVVGDRTFADFALDRPEFPGTASSLLIPVYSAKHGTLLLPRDLPKLGLTDLPVADALVAATRIPGALPAAAGLEDVFDGGCQYRVPHHFIAPHPALVLDLYGPQPYNSRGGLLFPLLHPSLRAIPNRPRPFRDPASSPPPSLPIRSTDRRSRRTPARPQNFSIPATESLRHGSTPATTRSSATSSVPTSSACRRRPTRSTIFNPSRDKSGKCVTDRLRFGCASSSSDCRSGAQGHPGVAAGRSTYRG